MCPVLSDSMTSWIGLPKRVRSTSARKQPFADFFPAKGYDRPSRLVIEKIPVVVAPIVTSGPSKRVAGKWFINELVGMYNRKGFGKSSHHRSPGINLFSIFITMSSSQQMTYLHYIALERRWLIRLAWRAQKLLLTTKKSKLAERGFAFTGTCCSFCSL